MSYSPDGRWARTPLWYPLVFLLNVALIITLELLLIYRYSLPLTAETLARKDSTYENASFHTSAEGGTITWYLAETEAGEFHLVPVRRHALFFNRCKICTDQIVPIPADTAEMKVTTRAGLGGATVRIGTEVAPRGEEPSGDGLKMLREYANSGATYTYSGYILLGIALSFLESFLWNKRKA